MSRDFDIVVIGGGHAGVEAASAGARMGCRTALVSLHLETIGRMSCNPAIGGVGKGQIVREIDALGGLMGRAADLTGVQFRMLNRSKGKAVWGPRCQSDRHAYERLIQQTLAAMPNLTLVQGEAVAILAEANSGSSPARRVVGVRLADGGELSCRSTVVTTGTFLRGLLHRGPAIWPGGRIEEPSAEHLSGSLTELGVQLDRLKTGTCARLAAETIDYSLCERQDGDEHPIPFSLMTDALAQEQMCCWITRTNPRVHQLIRDNFSRAPLYTGQITAAGPRYCPSIETKIDRFADKDSHQIFLEPEGRTTNSVYINGLSTSLPEDVQDQMIHAVAGLERAEILRYGYAIEYDYAPPTQLSPILETKAAAGLFLAGQINGTTGYEEAASLGLLAGLNAAQQIRGGPSVVLRRDQAYIGVMIDDLVTKGVTEPYRMFTSRAEHRLQLRADNAELRLTELAHSLGLVDGEQWRRFGELKSAAVAARDLMEATRLAGRSIATALANPQVTLESLLRSPAADESAGLQQLRELAIRHPAAMDLSETDCRYAGYVARQQRQVEQMSDLDGRRIPDGLDYQVVPHLRAEACQKLLAIRPRTLGQALRISGLTPADITVLAIHLHAMGRSGE